MSLLDESVSDYQEGLAAIPVPDPDHPVLYAALSHQADDRGM